ncbi:uncharacterized protein LOC125049973 [Pieris napi]|uniref:uncharacterized protein LOC125049973 n=1 Tax=Pieris napi TaxID=78633 RepID=UPI001FBA198A|nr:uncharacterized protein LOC125049973 [Pieris napi]
MDKEANKLNRTNTNTNKPRVASLDASRCKSPVARFSDAPVTHMDAPSRAASGTPKERAAAGVAPIRAALRPVPNPMESLIQPHKDVTTAAARLAASVEPKMATPDDDTALSASEGGASAARAMRQTEAATVGTSSAITTTMDMSALKTAIQEPTFKMVVSNSKRRRHRRALRAPEQQKLVTGAPRPPVKPGTAPAVTTVERGGKRTPKPKRSTAAPVPSCSGCGKGLKSSKTNQATKGQKRNRPEETVTPTGESKRVKPNKPQTVAGTSASYAEAAASYKTNELCVAVMTEPFVDMTQEQADNIRLQIEGKIQDELLADLDATLTTEPNDIRFRGKAHFSDGVLKTWCEDTYTLGWLTGTCDVITNPIPDTRLVVRPQSAIPNRIPCLLHVPDYSGNTETLRKLITRQNRHLNIRSWTLTHERRTQDPTGVSLFFRVPEFEIPKIKERNRRLYYLMGNIYIRILDRDEPSQVANAPPTTTSTSGVASSGSGPSTSLTGAASVTGTHAPMEVATHPPSPVQLTSDDELFQETGGSEFSDSCLRSSPSPN